MTGWDGDQATAQRLQNDLKVTLRCLPDEAALADLLGDGASVPTTDPFTGNPAKHTAVWARAY